MARYISTASLDFDTIKEDIINHFKANDTFKDYDFTGSGLNVLIDILAYNTHYNALTANLSINEMFIDSAVKRDSVVSIAKGLGYTPRSSRAARAYPDIRISGNTNTNLSTFATSPDTLTIPAFTPFLSKAGNASFTFYTLRDYTVGKTQNDINGISQTTFLYPATEIAEGTLITQTFTAAGSAQSNFETFDLTNSNIDTTTLRVAVDGIAWRNVTDLGSVVNVNSSSEVYFVDEFRNKSYQINFGNDILGKRLLAGQTITISYLQTSEDAANNISSFNLGSLIADGTNRYSIEITNTSTVKSSGGETIESKDEIRENATNWFGAQNRATTVRDYEAIIKNNFQNISSISVWGGEDNIPADFGSVYISIQPKVPAGGTLSDLTKSQIVNDLKTNYNVVSIQPKLVDPVQTDIIVKTLVLFDEARLTGLSNTLETNIINLFNTWNNSYIGDFLLPFRISRANTEIVATDPALVSANTRVNLSRTIISDSRGLFTTYQIDFGNRLYNPHAGFNNDNGGILSSSTFTLPGESNLAGFDDDGNGNIRLFNLINNRKIYKPGFSGTIDYLNGILNINELVFSPNTSVNLIVAPESYDVLAGRNNILKVSTSQSIVNAIAQTETALIQSLDSSRGI